LFHWDGASELVTDIDYLVFGNTANAVDKTGVTVGQSSYKNDTPPVSQVASKKPEANKSLHRCDTAESSETAAGGNGRNGHDETSEDGQAAWKLTASASPLAAPAAAVCP
jgi:hypothetical protein